MPKFYFHTRIGEKLTTDEVGVDLPDIEAAKDAARASAGEMLRDGTLQQHEVLEVMDEHGDNVLRFKCADVEQVQ